MRRYSERSNLQTVTELNVTPLLDLAFVLLIIFMITTPLIENSIDLHVPTSAAAANAVDPKDVQILSINRNYEFSLNDQEIALADLEQRLIEMKEKAPSLAVVVRPDRTLSIQRFVAVMDILKNAGITKIGVMTQPESSAAPASP